MSRDVNIQLVSVEFWSDKIFPLFPNDHENSFEVTLFRFREISINLPLAHFLVIGWYIITKLFNIFRILNQIIFSSYEIFELLYILLRLIYIVQLCNK